MNEQYEQKEHALPSNSILCEQEDGQINDVQEEGYNHLFYENCNYHVINSVNDDSKEVFRIPIYDEYKDHYLDVVPKKTICRFCTFRARYFQNMKVRQRLQR